MYDIGKLSLPSYPPASPPAADVAFDKAFDGLVGRVFSAPILACFLFPTSWSDIRERSNSVYVHVCKGARGEQGDGGGLDEVVRNVHRDLFAMDIEMLLR